MLIGDLLTVDRIICNADLSSKKRAIELISELFSRSIGAEATSKKVFESLINREKLGSTGLGKGIAIPHARLEGLNNAIGILIKLKKSISYDAIDGEPVDIMFALLVPEHYTDEHLNILAILAEMFSDNDLCNLLRLNTTAEPMLKLLDDWAKARVE